MTPQQIALVRATFAQVEPQATYLARCFYRRLFEIAPDTERLFQDSDMHAQGRMLIAMLKTAVAALETPAPLLAALDALGRRHAGYGVEPRHYDAVGEALLAALAMFLKADFTAEVQAAWASAYALIAGRMQAAASALNCPASPPPAPAQLAA